MTNLRIVPTNTAKTAALSASSTAGILAITNTQLDSKSKVYRSVGTSATITATMASSLVSCVSMPICNLSSTATMRVRCYTLSGDTTPVLDTGTLLCCEYTTIDKIDFSGVLSANAYAYGGGTYATLFFAEQTAQKVVIDIVDTANSAGYIEACFLVIGKYLSPTNNADYGASLSFTDTSKHKRSESGDLNTNRGAVYKSLKFTLKNIGPTDRKWLMEFFIRNGMSKPFFISIFPSSADTQEKQIYQIYGKQKKLGSFTRTYYSADKASIDIEEV